MPADRPAAPRSPLISVADYERAAAGAIAPGALGYYDGGAGDEITLRDNVAAWQRFAIRPRVLVGAEQRDTSVTLLGRPRPHPLIIAPMAWQQLAHAEGEIATARAAAATGAIMCLATLTTTTPPALAQAVPGAARWFQLYVFSDRGVSHELVAQAVEHGYEALVITVDLPVVGVRERELRLEDVIESETAAMLARAQAAGTMGEMTPMDFAQQVDPDLSWADIERFAAGSPLPVIVKARAVMVGRPLLWGLAVDGADGARRVLEILLAELDVALGLSGAPRAAGLDRSLVTAAPWAPYLR